MTLIEYLKSLGFLEETEKGYTIKISIESTIFKDVPQLVGDDVLSDMLRGLAYGGKEKANAYFDNLIDTIKRFESRSSI